MVKQYSAEFKLEVAKLVVGYHCIVAKTAKMTGVSLAYLIVEELKTGTGK